MGKWEGYGWVKGKVYIWGGLWWGKLEVLGGNRGRVMGELRVEKGEGYGGERGRVMAGKRGRVTGGKG